MKKFLIQLMLKVDVKEIFKVILKYLFANKGEPTLEATTTDTFRTETSKIEK